MSIQLAPSCRNTPVVRTRNAAICSLTVYRSAISGCAAIPVEPRCRGTDSAAEGERDGLRDDRYGPAFAFLATTGMRRGEALGLRWDDLDLEGGTAAIRRASIAIDHKPVVGATKSGRAREIELDGMTVAILRQQWSRQAQERLLVGEGYSNENLLFCLPDGRGFHPERFSREFERKQATYNRLHPSAPLPRLRLHDLRHTWATLALKAGENPKVVAERLGHSSTNVTLNTYSHVTKAMASNAAENVAAMIFGNGA